MLGLLGKKLGQTRVYDAQGNVVPVTMVLAGPNHVLQCKTVKADGYEAVQLGFDPQKDHRLTKPMQGHLKKQKGPPLRRIREFRNFAKKVKPGDVLGADLFVPGDFVDAIGITKGRGFSGVMRRFNFSGGTGSHGNKGWKRRPGAVGQGTFPGTIRKGMPMPGQMGQVRRTVQSLEVMQVHSEDNLLLIKGSIPGAKGDYVVIRQSKKIPRKEQPAQEATPEKSDKGKPAGKK